VRKLFIGSIIVFLMIFTAGLATAAAPPTATTIQAKGNLWFVASATGDVTEVTGATLTLTKVTPTAGQPNNIWTGTLVLPYPNPLSPTVETTLDITAFEGAGSGNPHTFHDITGTNGATQTVLLTATGRDNETARDSALTTPALQKDFGISGKLYDSGAFVGAFEGALFYSK
jgi:hypothetical protein